ncbi:MAG: sensor histidine kinase, partial [Sphingobacterium sp.]
MLTKIRILLLILTLSLVGTAITIHLTITSEDILSLDERKLTSKIHEFEDRIQDVLNDTLVSKTFQNVDNFPIQVSTISNELAQENIYFYIYRDNQVIHWSTNIYVPVTDVGLRRETSYLQSENRSFLVRKKELNHGISVLALVPIRDNFQSTNRLLKNSFLPDINVNNIEIAQYNDDKNIRNIYSKDKSYLFSVKLIEGKKDNIYITLQFICWVAAMICFLVLINSVCLHLVKNEYPWLAVLLLLAALIMVHYLDLKSNWLSIHSSLELFDPKYYAYNEFLPNTWSYLTTTASIFWLICFIKIIQQKLTLPSFIFKGYAPIAISIIGVFSIYATAQLMYYFLGTLLTHSPLYEQDFTRILDLNFYGWVCLILFCFNIATLILYIDGVLEMIRNLLNDITLLLNIELICLIISLIVMTFIGLNVFFCIFLGILIFLRTYRTYKDSTPYQLSVFIITILLISSISVITYNHYNRIKKSETMKLAISHLLAEDDMNAVSLFIEFEKSIIDDVRLEKIINLNDNSNNVAYITDYIKTRYLSGYLSKFDFEAYYYNNDGRPLQNYEVNKAAEFREDVIKSAIKIPLTTNFYRLRSELGTHEYITHISVPYEQEPDKRYHIYLNLKNQSYRTSLPYPEILSDNQNPNWQSETIRDNSYALYKGGSLVTQYGAYSYPETDLILENKIEQYSEIQKNDNYVHLGYKPDPYTSIVISKQKTTLWEFLALGSIIFIVLLVFFGVFNVTNYMIKTITDRSFKWRRIRYHFRLLFNNTQYSTRIQALVILSVLLGIFISGAIAFISINRQIEESTTINRMREISEITKRIENHLGSVKNGLDSRMVAMLKDMAPSTMTNFNLYNRSGKLLYSSQPRIFDLKLISNYINPSALNKLAILRKSEAYEQESISNFKFASVYSTLKDENYKTMAYINIPYY